MGGKELRHLFFFQKKKKALFKCITNIASRAYKLTPDGLH
jgi:hypothetical protein